MNRWQAAGIHLCISIAVIGAIAVFVFLVWYPHGLYHVAGLDRLMLTLAGIDLVIGPLLTCVVYAPRKPSLRRDLAVIGVVQAAFLAYGLHTAWASRPVFLVGAINRITLVFANQIDDDALAAASHPEYASLPWFGPRLVGALPPTDEATRQTLMFSAVTSGVDIQVLPRFYVPYAQVATTLLTHARDTSSLATPGSDADAQVKAGIAATAQPASSLRALPLMSMRGEGAMLVDATTAAPLRTVPVEIDARH